MRLETLTEATMTPAQRRVADETISGKRGRIPAPLQAWLHSPVLGDHAQKLGEFCRYNTSLGPVLSELAILTVARLWTAHFEWYAHKRDALKAGLSPEIINAIATRQTPKFDDEKSALVYEYAMVLQTEKIIPEALHVRAINLLEQQGVVELVGVIGYYTFTAMTLNAFDIDVPAGEVRELLP